MFAVCLALLRRQTNIAPTSIATTIAIPTTNPAIAPAESPEWWLKWKTVNTRKRMYVCTYCSGAIEVLGERGEGDTVLGGLPAAGELNPNTVKEFRARSIPLAVFVIFIVCGTVSSRPSW